jgi:3-dehydroquinate synthetase
MLQDKKVKSGKINFVLPTGIGSCTFVNDLSEADIKEAIMRLGAKG